MASGEGVEHEDGSIRWGKDNKTGKQPGALIQRHPKAAPLITKENAAEFTTARLEKRIEAAEAGFAIGVSHVVGYPLQPDEAVAEIMARLGEAGMDPTRQDYARVIRLALEVMRVFPNKTNEAARGSIKIDIGEAEIKALVVDSGKFPFVKEMILGKDDESTERS